MNMSNKIFRFETDAESNQYFIDIYEKMIKLFGISYDEAIGRINQHFRHVDKFVGDEVLIYHETEEYWAKTIYYGDNSFWWLKEGKEELKPVPYV
jgi:hypothetical protein